MRIICIVIFSLILKVVSFAQCISGDCQNGIGGYLYLNGDKYIGEFKNGKRDGVGTLKRADGIEYHGYFRNDKEDIFGQFNLETNDIIHGLIENGNLLGYSYSFNLSALSNITESYYNSSGESEPFDQSNNVHMQSRQKYDLLQGNYMNRNDKLRSEMELIDEKTGFKLFYME